MGGIKFDVALLAARVQSMQWIHQTRRLSPRASNLWRKQLTTDCYILEPGEIVLRLRVYQSGDSKSTKCATNENYREIS